MPNVSRVILDSLWAEGVSAFFMVPGKQINAFMSNYRDGKDDDHPRILPVISAAEGGAAMMADGYARASERFGVVIALDGPGVTNTIGGISTACADRSPVALLSGHVPTGFDAHDALQDVTPTGLDTASVLRPLTSTSLQVRSAAHPIRYFDITLRKLVEQPTRPVYLSYAADVLFAETSDAPPRTSVFSKSRLMCDPADLERVIDTVNASSSVAVLVGSHANKKAVRALLTRLSEKHDILVGSMLDAKGAFTESHPNNVGVFGYSGNQRAHELFMGDGPETALLIGCRPSQWNTNGWAGISGAENVIEVASEVGDIGKLSPRSQALLCDELAFLEHWEASLAERRFPGNAALRQRVEQVPLHDAIPDEGEVLNPAQAVVCLNTWLKDRICIADSGNHRSFATHYWTTDIDAGFYSTTNMGMMGWAFGAAVGISFARDEPCLVITGDGCTLMQGMEIQTAVRYGRNIIFAIFDNASYGATHMNNLQNIPELSALPSHDWVKFAESMGATGFRVTSIGELDTVTQKIKDSEGVHVLHLVVDRDTPTPAGSYRNNLKAFVAATAGAR